MRNNRMLKLEEIEHVIDIELRVTYITYDGTEPMGTGSDLVELFEDANTAWFYEAFNAAAIADGSTASITSVESIGFVPNPKPGFPVYATVLLLLCGFVIFIALMNVVRNKQLQADAAKKGGPVVELTQQTEGKYMDSRNAKGELVLKYTQTAI